MQRLSLLLAIGVILLLIIGTLVYISTAGDGGGSRPSTRTLQIGAYTVDMQWSRNPPQVEEPLVVTLVPHGQIALSGKVKAVPGLGTDAPTVTVPLVADTKQPGALTGALHMPVRGAWSVVIELNGPQGPATAQIDTDVAAPHAIPTWFGWLIGLSPLVGVAWFFWQQGRYRKALLAAK
jgi:hypothetical protein